MPENMIEKLRGASLEDRPLLLQATYNKNIDFFKNNEKFMAVHEFLESTECPYHFDLTTKFVNIVHTPTGELAHPAVGLNIFAEMLGDWVHDTWIDLVNISIPASHDLKMHYGPVDKLHRTFLQAFPEYVYKLQNNIINLKELDDGRKFSPPVVFLGIFHGLHIDFYLNRTELNAPLFVEPEKERFEVSCYFLDYQKIYERFGELYLILGPDFNSSAYRNYFLAHGVTSQAWLRVLPGYASESMPLLVSKLKTTNTVISNIHFPLEHELAGLHYGCEALKKGYPILTRRSQLSVQSRIAVVAPGPSLENDIQWLKDNREKLIIFAVHSAVRGLRLHGIKPDFQFNLDAILELDVLRECKLYDDVPLVSLYKMAKHVYNEMETHILCAEKNKPNLVEFTHLLQYSPPATANLTFSFACFCQPRTIYLLGCDFGYRSIERSHIRGSIHTEYNLEGSTAKSNTATRVAPNFRGTGEIESNTYLSQSREEVELAIKDLLPDTEVINCSDGAFISGVIPQRTSTLHLEPYDARQEDVGAILNCVAPAAEGVNWKPYSVSGKHRLQEVIQAILAVVQQESFDWKEVSAAIDNSYKGCYAGRKELGDQRMGIYDSFVRDIMYTWYCCLISLDSEEKAAEAYALGYEVIANILGDLEWPREFDDFS